MTFVATAYRWADRNGHHYVVYAGPDEATARRMAEAEVDWVAWLHRRGAPVVRPYPTRQGGWVARATSEGVELSACLMERLRGDPMEGRGWTPPLIEDLGAVMGRLHALTRDYVPGVGALCKQIAERGLSNLRICQHDAVEVVRDMLPEGSLDGVHVFFPDPWHKARHNKRRLIQPPFVALLASRLKPGGYFHCATDWEEYAHQMLEVLSGEPMLVNSVDGFAPRPEYRPLTKFENRGIRLGHGVWDVIFKKR